MIWRWEVGSWTGVRNEERGKRDVGCGKLDEGRGTRDEEVGGRRGWKDEDVFSDEY